MYRNGRQLTYSSAMLTMSFCQKFVAEPRQGLSVHPSSPIIACNGMLYNGPSILPRSYGAEFFVAHPRDPHPKVNSANIQ